MISDNHHDESPAATVPSARVGRQAVVGCRGSIVERRWRSIYRYPRKAIGLLAALAPTLDQAIAVAAGKAYVILDGTLLRIDRVGITSGYDRAF